MEKVFYVESNALLRTMNEATFKVQGGDLYTLDDVSEALRLIRELSPILVVLDMKTISKNESAKNELLEWLRVAQIPVALTVEPRNELAIPQGPWRVIGKPLGPFEIWEVFEKTGKKKS
jgi:DNA-binding response OmpR family regulator